MADRYTTTTREVPVERERSTVFVPGDTAVHSYRCPVHGIIEVQHPVGDVPREWPCNAMDRVGRPSSRLAYPETTWERCTKTATLTATDLNSQTRVSLHPAGFRVRERGALEGTVVHAYRCPVHGLVDVRVPRADVPDVVSCTKISEPPTILVLAPWKHNRDGTETWVSESGVEFRVKDGRVLCDCLAHWAGSLAGQGWAAGECRS